jgi:hypothetical protein
MFAPIQSDFAAALLDPARPVPATLTAHSGGVPDKRFAVYRNNVVAGLINALRSRFPAVEKIVGAEFFAAMARVFVDEHPPRSKILSEYGDDFADFLATFPPAGHLRYLPDVARLEAARTRAYHAADAAPVAHEALVHFDPETLFKLKVALHPSVQIVRSRHPIVTIWAMNSGELTLGPIDEDAAEDALVIRPQLDVLVRKLPCGGADFLAALVAGLALGEAAQRAADADHDFNLAANLAGLIESGVMAGLSAG